MICPERLGVRDGSPGKVRLLLRDRVVRVRQQTRLHVMSQLPCSAPLLTPLPPLDPGLPSLALAAPSHLAWSVCLCLHPCEASSGLHTRDTFPDSSPSQGFPNLPY